jgi:L-amino acid N-acyltransferase YncA
MIGAMSSAHPTVRPATSADLTQVTDIYSHYVKDTVITFDEVPPEVATWHAKLDDLTDRGLPFLVAEGDDHTIGGFAYAGPWRPKRAYRHTVEDTIYLAPGFTGRGVGSALLGTLIDCCDEAGLRLMIAVIAVTDSDASPALHRRFGFTDAGRLTGAGFKHGRWIDTILMQRVLDAEATP